MFPFFQISQALWVGHENRTIEKKKKVLRAKPGKETQFQARQSIINKIMEQRRKKFGYASKEEKIAAKYKSSFRHVIVRLEKQIEENIFTLISLNHRLEDILNYGLGFFYRMCKIAVTHKKNEVASNSFATMMAIAQCFSKDNKNLLKDFMKGAKVEELKPDGNTKNKPSGGRNRQHSDRQNNPEIRRSQKRNF